MAKQLLTFASGLLLLLLLSPTWAGIIAQPSLSHYGDEHAVAHTQQNVVRSFDGTVSHYAKSVATPYAQVHKQDTRISNNVYQPAIAKTVTYHQAEPAAAAVYNHHAHPEPQLFTQAAPQAAVYSAPQAALYHQAAPQASVYHQSATPVVSHQPAVIHYSPAESVSHMSFDGFGTHWGF
ncbi:larval/pupal cuticle protein H1C [Drosophila guanche]|uniref:Blast:Larval/pupal cuticle protein H1C n=1 Tax=Drosophila guanche TaxID=7266 RepID=A0A3B0JWU9_DROGU|nr:larval/pupal cuticle protein H1C [Drosophila guanche]SPP77201.1 blast:Larval/pupal cuticle protein H1C [Drosophila guanche]